VVGHLVGRSEEVPWTPDAEPELTAPGEEAAGAGPASPREIARVEPAARAGGAPVSTGSELPAVGTAPPARRPGRAPGGEPSGASSVSPLRSAAAAAESRGFADQVGAFADGGVADEIREKLRSHGFESFVIPASESSDGKWRVRVGPVPTRGAAEQLASRLKTEERLPTWVLQQGGGS
jgi:cell division septation protein DedD